MDDIVVLVPDGPDLLGEPLAEAADRLASEGVTTSRVLVAALRACGHQHSNATMFAAARSALAGRPRTPRRRVWNVVDARQRDALDLLAVAAPALATVTHSPDPAVNRITGLCREIVAEIERHRPRNTP